MRRRLIVPGMLTRSSVPGDADTPSGAEGETAPEGGQTAQEWLDDVAEFVGGIWLARFPGGRDW